MVYMFYNISFILCFVTLLRFVVIKYLIMLFNNILLLQCYFLLANDLKEEEEFKILQYREQSHTSCL